MKKQKSLLQSLYRINRQVVFLKRIDFHDCDVNNKDLSDTDTSSETDEKRFPEQLKSLFNLENIKFPEDKIKAESELRYHNYQEIYSQNNCNILYEKKKKKRRAIPKPNLDVSYLDE